MIVSLQKVFSYDEDIIYYKLLKIFDDIGGINSFIKKGSRVLLKVNLITDTPPEVAATTHPAVVGALIRIIQEAGGFCWVGDSSGGSCYGLTSQSYKKSQINVAVEKYGATWKNFDISGAEEIVKEDNVYVKKAFIAKPVLEADLVISVAKLKNHTLTLYSGAIKNMLGSIPGSGKKIIHQISPKPNELADSLLDIYKLTKPTIGIIDGIIGQDGEGPVRGNPYQANLLMGSSDCLALDAVALELIGYDSQKHPLIAKGISRQLGVGNLDEIEIKGEPFKECLCLDWETVCNQHVTEADENLVRKHVMGPEFKVVPKIKETCVACRLCVDSCPVEAIEIMESRAHINYEKCIECYCCHELCRYNSVELQKSNSVIKLYEEVQKHIETIRSEKINILKG